MNYLGIRFEDGKLDLTVRPGAYRILTSNRLPSGNQLAMEYRFCIKNGEKKEIEMKLESVKTEYRGILIRGRRADRACSQ